MAEWADGLNDADEWDFDVDNFLPTLSSGKKCDIKVSEGKSNLWLGRAQVWIEGDHITKGDVKVNTDLLDSLFDDDFDADHVLCQEFGHVFGLNHSGDSDTCMNDSILGQPTPNAHDFQELNYFYNHVDSGGGGDGPGGGNGPPGKPFTGTVTHLMLLDGSSEWHVSAHSVAEPSSMAMATIGLVFLLQLTRRNKRNHVVS